MPTLTNAILRLQCRVMKQKQSYVFSLSKRALSSTAAPKLATKITEDGTTICPPNLKIDYRAKSSPFYGLKQIKEEDYEDLGTVEEDGNDVEKDQQEISELLSKLNLENGAIAYDASSGDYQNELRAIPLPERLSVPVLNFDSVEYEENDENVIELNEDIFGMDPIRPDLIHRVVIYQRNKKRGKRTALAKNIRCIYHSNFAYFVVFIITEFLSLIILRILVQEVAVVRK